MGHEAERHALSRQAGTNTHWRCVRQLFPDRHSHTLVCNRHVVLNFVEDYKNHRSVRDKVSSVIEKTKKASAASSSVDQKLDDTVEVMLVQLTKIVISVDVYSEEVIKRAVGKQRAPKSALKRCVTMEVPSIKSVGSLETLWPSNTFQGVGHAD